MKTVALLAAAMSSLVLAACVETTGGGPYDPGYYPDPIIERETVVIVDPVEDDFGRRDRRFRGRDSFERERFADELRADRERSRRREDRRDRRDFERELAEERDDRVRDRRRGDPCLGLPDYDPRIHACDLR